MLRTDIELIFPNTAMDDVATLVEHKLGVSFQLRYSDMMGGYYHLAEKDGEELRVKMNREYDELAEEGFLETDALLQVDSTRRPEAIKRMFCDLGAVVIREYEYDIPK